MPGIVQNQDHEQWIQSVAKALNISLAAELEEAEPGMLPFAEDPFIEEAGIGPLPPELQKLDDLGHFRKRLSSIQASSRACFKRKSLLEDTSELLAFEAAHADVSGSLETANKLLKSYETASGADIAEIEGALLDGETALERMQRAYNEGRDSILRMVKDTKDQARAIAADLDAQSAWFDRLKAWPIDLKDCDRTHAETRASITQLSSAIDKCELPDALNGVQQAKASYDRHVAALAKAQSARDALKAQLESKAARVERAAHDASSGGSVLENHPLQLGLFEVLRDQVVANANKARAFLKQEQGRDAQTVLEGTDEVLAAMASVLAKVQTGDKDISTAEGNAVEFKIIASDLTKVSTQADQLFQTRRADVAQLGAEGADFQNMFDTLQQSVQEGQRAVLTYDMAQAQRHLEAAQGQLKQMTGLAQAVTAAFAAVADDIAQMRHQLTETVKTRRKYNSYFALTPDEIKAQNTFDSLYYKTVPQVDAADQAFKQHRLSDAQEASRRALMVMMDLSMGLQDYETAMQNHRPHRDLPVLDDLAFQVEACRQTLVTYQNKAESFNDTQARTTFGELTEFANGRIQRARDLIDAKEDREAERALVEVQLAVETVSVALEQGAQTAKTYADLSARVEQAKKELARSYDQRSTVTGEGPLNDFLSYNSIALDLVFEVETLLDGGRIKEAQDALVELETALQRLHGCLALKLDAEEHDSAQDESANETSVADPPRDTQATQLKEACQRLKLALHTSHAQWRPSCLKELAGDLEQAFVEGVQHVEKAFEALGRSDYDTCTAALTNAKLMLSQMQFWFSKSQELVASDLKNLKSSWEFYSTRFDDLYAKKQQFQNWKIETFQLDSVYEATKGALSDLTSAMKKLDLIEAKAVESGFHGLLEAMERALLDCEEQAATQRTEIVVAISGCQSELDRLFARSSELLGHNDVLDEFLARHDEAMAEVEEAHFQLRAENGVEAGKSLKAIRRLIKVLEKTLSQADPGDEAGDAVLPQDEPAWLTDMAAFERKKSELVAESDRLLKAIELGYGQWKPECEGIYSGMMDKFKSDALDNIAKVHRLQEETEGDLLKITLAMTDGVFAAYQCHARMKDIHGVSRSLLQFKLKSLSQRLKNYEDVFRKVEAQAQTSIAWGGDLTAYAEAQQNALSVMEELRAAISKEQAERGMDMFSLIEQKITGFAVAMKALEEEQKRIKADLVGAAQDITTQVVKQKDTLLASEGDEKLAKDALHHCEAALKAAERTISFAENDEADAARAELNAAKQEQVLVSELCQNMLDASQQAVKTEFEQRLDALKRALADAEDQRAEIVKRSDSEEGQQYLRQYDEVCEMIGASIAAAAERALKEQYAIAKKIVFEGEREILKLPQQMKFASPSSTEGLDSAGNERAEEIKSQLERLSTQLTSFTEEEASFWDSTERKMFAGYCERAKADLEQAHRDLSSNSFDEAESRLNSALTIFGAMGKVHDLAAQTAQKVEDYIKDIHEKRLKHTALAKERELIRDRRELEAFERSSQTALNKINTATSLIQTETIKPVAETLGEAAQELASMERLLRIQSDAKHKLKNLFRSRKKK